MIDSVLIMGAGRTGSLAAEEFAKRDTKVYVYNRTPKKAQRLAAYVMGQAIALDRIPEVGAIIDCTDAGAATDLGSTITSDEELAAMNADRLARNIEQKNTLYAALSGTNAPIFLYTNPPDTLAAYGAFALGRDNIFGVGLELDVTRARKAVLDTHGADIADRIRAVGVHNRPIILGNDFGIKFDQHAIQAAVLAQLEETLEDEESYASVQRAALADLADFVTHRRTRFHLTCPQVFGAQQTYADFTDILTGEYVGIQISTPTWFGTRIGMPVRWDKGEIVPQDYTLTPAEQALLDTQLMDVARGMYPHRMDRSREAFDNGETTQGAVWVLPELALMERMFSERREESPDPDAPFIRVGKVRWGRK